MGEQIPAHVIFHPESQYVPPVQHYVLQPCSEQIQGQHSYNKEPEGSHLPGRQNGSNNFPGKHGEEQIYQCDYQGTKNVQKEKLVMRLIVRNQYAQ